MTNLSCCSRVLSVSAVKLDLGPLLLFQAFRFSIFEFRFSRFDSVGLERETGIEPATSSLGSSRSTAELLPLSLSAYQKLEAES